MKTIIGTITGIRSYGAFVKTDDGEDGLIHISEFSDGYVSNIKDFVNIGDRVTLKLIDTDKETNKLRLSFKRANKNLVIKKREIICLEEGFEPLRQNLDKWIETTLKGEN